MRACFSPLMFGSIQLRGNLQDSYLIFLSNNHKLMVFKGINENMILERVMGQIWLPPCSTIQCGILGKTLTRTYVWRSLELGSVSERSSLTLTNFSAPFVRHVGSIISPVFTASIAAAWFPDVRSDSTRYMYLFQIWCWNTHWKSH